VRVRTGLSSVASLREVPRIETARLELRAWDHRDLATYARIIADPAVMRHMGSGPRYRIERAVAALLRPLAFAEARRRIAHMVGHWKTWGYGEWAVEEKESGELIGQVGLVHQADWFADRTNVEVGWMLARRAWGRGLATEGALATLAFGFGELGLERLVSITRPANLRSLRVMQRAGLSFAGRTRWKGEEVVWYAIDRANWDGGERQSAAAPRAHSSGEEI
jgi:RimJ/RimL family protein N-acetyltransferase